MIGLGVGVSVSGIFAVGLSNISVRTPSNLNISTTVVDITTTKFFASGSTLVNS